MSVQEPLSEVTGEDRRRRARDRRIQELIDLISRGDYLVPAEEVAEAILRGRPRWGERFAEAASGTVVWTRT